MCQIEIDVAGHNRCQTGFIRGLLDLLFTIDYLRLVGQAATLRIRVTREIRGYFSVFFVPFVVRYFKSRPDLSTEFTLSGVEGPQDDKREQINGAIHRTLRCVCPLSSIVPAPAAKPRPRCGRHLAKGSLSGTTWTSVVNL